MEELNKVFTEQQVEEVSEKILKSTIKKVKSELTNNFYNEMNDFIYQHYNNASDKIHERLIEEITDEFIAEPKDYKFLKLRQKLFNENKEVLTTILIDDERINNGLLRQIERLKSQISGLNEMEDYKKLIKNSTHQITDENLNKWKVIELSDLEEILQAYHESKVKTLGLFSVSKQRELLIDFYKSLDFWSGENKQNLAEFKADEYLKSNL